MGSKLLQLLALLLLLAGCDREPDGPALEAEIQGLLEREFRSGILELASLRRLGSARYRDPNSGDRRMTVYFNAQLRFREAFDLTAWDGLNAASVAFLLGATERGIAGIQPAGNQAGDLLQIHGSRVYALRQGEWRPLLSATTGVESNEQVAESQRLIARIQALSEQTAGRRGGEEQAIINSELGGALKRIERKLDSQAEILAAASGPRNGAYYRYLRALEQNPRALGVLLKNFPTQGSVENCQLVQAGSVDMAIAQSNTTAQAREGKGAFEQTGPLPGLRAVSALFPEYVQIIVAADSGIETLAELAGKRIDFGQPESGTRVDALRLLDAAGLRLQDFAEIQETGLETAVQGIYDDTLDAFFTTQQAPSRVLQELLGLGRARLLSIPPAVRDAVATRHGVYRPAELPPHTYPGQPDAVGTLSVTATLIVRADFEAARVEALLRGLYQSIAALAKDDLRVSLLSRDRATEGLSIPLHPAAEAFFNIAASPNGDRADRSAPAPGGQ